MFNVYYKFFECNDDNLIIFQSVLFIIFVNTSRSILCRENPNILSEFTVGLACYWSFQEASILANFKPIKTIIRITTQSDQKISAVNSIFVPPPKKKSSLSINVRKFYFRFKNVVIFKRKIKVITSSLTKKLFSLGME